MDPWHLKIKEVEKYYQSQQKFLHHYYNAKILAWFINPVLRCSRFLSPVARVVTPIFNHANPNNLQSIFNFLEFVLKSKNQAISSIFSEYIVDLKILQFDWLKAFWPTTQEPDFSQIWNFSRHTA